MDFTTAKFFSMTIHEGINDIPRIILRFKDSKQYGYSGGIREVDIDKYKGFIDKIVGRDIYINLTDPNIFQTFESKYLGNSLFYSIKSLNLKPDTVGNFEDIHQDFYMMKETPWHAFIRLSRYLPKEYYIACLYDKIKIFKNPDEGSFRVLHISEYETQADYSTEHNNLIIGMNNDSDSSNPSYGGLVLVPLSKMIKDDIITDTGTDIVNNYLSHYKNKDSYFCENLLLSSINPMMEIGDGIKIDNAKFMIISKSITIGSTGVSSGAYRCIKVP